MTKTPPTINPNGRYSRTEAAKILEVTTQTLTRWQQIGMLIPKYYPHNNRPFYEGKLLIQFWHAYY